jgi:hypothetical protein
MGGCRTAAVNPGGGISKMDVTAIPRGARGGGGGGLLDKDKIRRHNKSEQGLKEGKTNKTTKRASRGQTSATKQMTKNRNMAQSLWKHQETRPKQTEITKRLNKSSYFSPMAVT